MNNEEILEIIKSKYKDVKFFDEFTIVFNKNITPYYDGCKRISYLRLEEASDKLCLTEVILQPYDSFKKKEDPIFKEIEFKIYLNNIIELKHIFGIEIARDDIVNYLEKELYSSYVDADGIGGWELKKSKYDNLIVEEYNEDGNFKLLLYEENDDGYNCSTISIFNASNSSEYWRLYNIINNLIEE